MQFFNLSNFNILILIVYLNQDVFCPRTIQGPHPMNIIQQICYDNIIKVFDVGEFKRFYEKKLYAEFAISFLSLRNPNPGTYYIYDDSNTYVLAYYIEVQKYLIHDDVLPYIEFCGKQHSVENRIECSYQLGKSNFLKIYNQKLILDDAYYNKVISMYNGTNEIYPIAYFRNIGSKAKVNDEMQWPDDYCIRQWPEEVLVIEQGGPSS